MSHCFYSLQSVLFIFLTIEGRFFIKVALNCTHIEAHFSPFKPDTRIVNVTLESTYIYKKNRTTAAFSAKHAPLSKDKNPPSSRIDKPVCRRYSQVFSITFVIRRLRHASALSSIAKGSKTVSKGRCTNQNARSLLVFLSSPTRLLFFYVGYFFLVLC